MIANKLYKQWRVDGNLSWYGSEPDDTEANLRGPEQETLEDELLRLNPEKWEACPEQAPVRNPGPPVCHDGTQSAAGEAPSG